MLGYILKGSYRNINELREALAAGYEPELDQPRAETITGAIRVAVGPPGRELTYPVVARAGRIVRIEEFVLREEERQRAARKVSRRAHRELQDE